MPLERVSQGFKDISMTFQANPLNEDLIALKNENAIARSIRNIVFTTPGEKFFNPSFGSRITESLFENIDDITATIIVDEIRESIENYEPQVWKPVAEKNILAGNLRQWILVEAIGRSENAYSGWTHLVFNVQAENPGDPVMMSGFKWDKLWEGIESSRDMSEADELVCVYSMN